jgi:hypothetical protein
MRVMLYRRVSLLAFLVSLIVAAFLANNGGNGGP